MSSALKPCPFCGSEKHSIFPPTCDKNTPYNPNDRAFPIIRCGGCFTEVPGKDWDASCKTAGQRWNDRATDAAKDAEIARLREALNESRSVAIEDTLGALTAHELYQYRPKAFAGFIEYARGALKENADG